MKNISDLKNLITNIYQYVKEMIDNDGKWEEVVDFTKIKKGGVEIDEILTHL